VYVCERTGTAWTQHAKLTASDAAATDEFGWSVAILGSTAFVGAPFEHLKAGAAYVFARSGDSWSQKAKVTASDAAEDDFFGGSVAISGSTAVVGAPRKNMLSGAAYVFPKI
jgi:FG-GAP repeat